MQNKYSLPLEPRVGLIKQKFSSTKSLPFYFSIVHEESELLKFQDAYKRMSGNDVSMTYLRAAIVVQFYLGWENIGGFVLNTVEMHPFRYFSYLRPGMSNKLLDAKNMSATCILESCCNWHKPTMSQLHRIQFYFVMLDHVRRLGAELGKTILMGGSVEKNVKLLQKMLLADSFYHGEIQHTESALTNDDTKLLEIYTTPIKRIRTRGVRVMVKKFLFNY